MSTDLPEALQNVLPDDLLRIPDAAKLLEVHEITCWKYVSANRNGIRLRSMKIGGKRFTRRAWVKDFIVASAVAE